MSGDRAASKGGAAATAGIDHVGLTVHNVGKSAAFFTECLGWRVVGERLDYPAIFISDGASRITLWQVRDPDNCGLFDRRNNIGLHHLAIRLPSLDQLLTLHSAVRKWTGVVIEFEPEPSGSGPKVHSMIREPGGCRIELCWDPRPTSS